MQWHAFSAAFEIREPLSVSLCTFVYRLLFGWGGDCPRDHPCGQRHSLLSWKETKKVPRFHQVPSISVVFSTTLTSLRSVDPMPLPISFTPHFMQVVGGDTHRLVHSIRAILSECICVCRLQYSHTFTIYSMLSVLVSIFVCVYFVHV